MKIIIAGAGEVGRYIKAIKALQYPTTNSVYNPSASISVWMKVTNSLVEISPQATITY